MRVDLFSTPIYMLNVADTEEGLKLSQAVSNVDIESLTEPNTHWDCTVDTGFFKKFEIPSEVKKAVKDCVIPHVKNYVATSTLLNNTDLHADIHELWLNRYFKGYSQEPHDHAGVCEISFNYIYKTATPDTSFKFINVLVPHINTMWFETLGLSFTGKEAAVNLRDGDLLLFPSFLTHSVFYRNENERITLSGNVKLTPLMESNDEAR